MKLLNFASALLREHGLCILTLICYSTELVFQVKFETVCLMRSGSCSDQKLLWLIHTDLTTLIGPEPEEHPDLFYTVTMDSASASSFVCGYLVNTTFIYLYMNRSLLASERKSHTISVARRHLSSCQWKISSCLRNISILHIMCISPNWRPPTPQNKPKETCKPWIQCD